MCSRICKAIQCLYKCFLDTKYRQTLPSLSLFPVLLCVSSDMGLCQFSFLLIFSLIATTCIVKVPSPIFICLLLLFVLRRSLQIPIPAWAMKATVFSSSGRGPFSFVCMSTLSLQMDCLTLLYSLQSCSTCWAVSAAFHLSDSFIFATTSVFINLVLI